MIHLKQCLDRGEQTNNHNQCPCSCHYLSRVPISPAAHRLFREEPEPEPWWQRSKVLVALVVVAVLGLIIASCGGAEPRRDPEREPVITSLAAPAAEQPTLLPSPPLVAEAGSTATRGTSILVTPAPVFDRVGYVNGLEYRWGVWQPAMEAYRIVTEDRSWSPSQISGRAEFAGRIMASESAFCWNVIRWGWPIVGQADLCSTIRTDRCSTNPNDTRTGCYSDAGFGQITQILRGPTSPLCWNHRICDKYATVASPYQSMLSFVVVMESNGRQPWCFHYSDGRPSHHLTNGDCATWPM